MKKKLEIYYQKLFYDKNITINDKYSNYKNITSLKNYYIIISCTLALVSIGLMMVASASSVVSVSYGYNAYYVFKKQLIWAILGIIFMIIMSKMPTLLYKKVAYPVMIIAILLLILVFSPFGREIGGNRNWIAIKQITIQPSEFMKLALCLWLSRVLSIKNKVINNHFIHSVIPIIPTNFLVILLIILGNDLGTCIIIIIIFFSLLFFSGYKIRFITVLLTVFIAFFLYYILTSKNRLDRFINWFSADCDFTKNFCSQSKNSIYSLASGGIFGLGLGQGRSKWNWLPEIHNDFIFTILGEELGLIGAIFTIVLFMILIISIMKISYSHELFFVKLFCCAFSSWLSSQIFINIAMTIGLMPVIGIPLPFISYGGSSLITNLLGIGICLSFIRNKNIKNKKYTNI